MNGKSEMQRNAEEQALLVKDEEARRGEIAETVAIPQMECIDGQTASSFLLLTFLLRKENWLQFEVQASAQVRKVRSFNAGIRDCCF